MTHLFQQRIYSSKESLRLSWAGIAVWYIVYMCYCVLNVLYTSEKKQNYNKYITNKYKYINI